MKYASLLAVLAFTQIGAMANATPFELPKVCYTTVDAKEFCTTDNLGKVQVFVYNAGWCGPCNQEMGDLSQLYSEFANEPVVFASLSGEGYQRGTKPDQTFLKAWKKQHSIPFVVAGKFRDFGKAFDAPNSIPFAVIVDKEGNVHQKGFIGANQVASIVRQLLQDTK